MNVFLTKDEDENFLAFLIFSPATEMTDDRDDVC